MKCLTISERGKNPISYFVTKQRQLKKLNTILGTHDPTFYILNRQQRQHRGNKTRQMGNIGWV